MEKNVVQLAQIRLLQMIKTKYAHHVIMLVLNVKMLMIRPVLLVTKDFYLKVHLVYLDLIVAMANIRRMVLVYLALQNVQLVALNNLVLHALLIPILMQRLNALNNVIPDIMLILRN